MLFQVRFRQSNQKFSVGFKNNSKAFNAGFQNLQIVTETPDVEVYAGDYEITPMVNEQTIPTAQKFMTDDVTVKAIPYAEVTNTANGLTVTIAE